MGHYRVPGDSWGIIERIIRRYPEEKKWYEGQQDMDTPKSQRVKREIEAIEKIYNNLKPEQQKVIRVRFWSARSRNMPYLWMQSCISYSEVQMKRIAGNFIVNVGKELGEI